MPITQDRMISVVEAATTILHNNKQILSILTSARSRVQEFAADPTTTRLENLFHSILEQTQVLVAPAEAIEPIAREDGHFRLAARRNSREKLALRARRRTHDPDPAADALDYEPPQPFQDSRPAPRKSNPKIPIKELATILQTEFPHGIESCDIGAIVAERFGEPDMQIQIALIKQLITEKHGAWGSPNSPYGATYFPFPKRPAQSTDPSPEPIPAQNSPSPVPDPDPPEPVQEAFLPNRRKAPEPVTANISPEQDSIYPTQDSPIHDAEPEPAEPSNPIKEAFLPNPR